MDLQWQIDIINGLIKENPESTVGDYFKLLAEIKAIEDGKAKIPSRKSNGNSRGVPKVRMARDLQAVPAINFHSLRDPKTGRFRPKDAAA